MGDACSLGPVMECFYCMNVDRILLGQRQVRLNSRLFYMILLRFVLSTNSSLSMYDDNDCDNDRVYLCCGGYDS